MAIDDKKEFENPHLWTWVRGSKKYQVSRYGAVVRVLKDGRRKPIKPYLRKRDNKGHFIKVDLDGKYREVQLARVVAWSFGLEGKPGQGLMFKNRMKTDPSLNNLEWVDKAEIGRRTGALSGKRSVAKCEAQVVIRHYPKRSPRKMLKITPIEHYSSGRAAAKAMGVSYQTIMDSCNKVSVYNKTGFLFRWSDGIIKEYEPYRERWVRKTKEAVCF